MAARKNCITRPIKPKKPDLCGYNELFFTPLLENFDWSTQKAILTHTIYVQLFVIIRRLIARVQRMVPQLRKPFSKENENQAVFWHDRL